MGVELLIGLFLLIGLLILFFWLFIYYIKKRSKAGIVISSIGFICVLSVFLINNIDELTISKENVKNDLKHIDIELNADFEIKKNTVSGMSERNQLTEIVLSKSEIKKIITKIKQSNNFKEYKNNNEVYDDDISLNQPIEGQIINIKYPEFYSREIYKEIDNIPTRIFLSVYEEKNILKYQKIED